MLLNSGQCHELAVAQEILGLVGLVFRIVGVEGFVRYIQVREQEGLGRYRLPSAYSAGPSPVEAVMIYLS